MLLFRKKTFKFPQILINKFLTKRDVFSQSNMRIIELSTYML